MPHSFPIPAVYVLFAALVFAAFWLGSKIGGWSSLAEAYLSSIPLEAGSWQGCFGVMQRSWFWRSNVLLKIASDQRGLYIKLWPFSLPFYPALFFPWADVSARRCGSRWHPVQFSFREVPGIKIGLDLGVARMIAAGAGQGWSDGQSLFHEPS